MPTRTGYGAPQRPHRPQHKPRPEQPNPSRLTALTPQNQPERPLLRGNQEWKALYKQRQTIERTFKSLKESRRLERHYERGRRRVALHVLMSCLTYQATSLVRLQTGLSTYLKWQVRRVP